MSLHQTNSTDPRTRAGAIVFVNEALNGWIKEELYTDFHIDKCRTIQQVREVLDNYIKYYNERRPCYAIGYDTPENYRKRYYQGELPKKDTFNSRELSELPKFVQKKIEDAENQPVKNDG